jgi:hypothetical protein
MSIRRPLIATATALAAIAVLAGCTATDTGKNADPTYSNTPGMSAAASSTPTPTVAPAQAQVAPPTSKDAALQAANKTAQAYLEYDFEMQENPELGAGYLANYIDGAMPKIEQDTVNDELANGYHSAGGPVTFEPDYGLSYAVTITDTANGNKQYPNGRVTLIGCADNTATTVAADPGYTAPAFPTGSFAGEFTLTYSPQAKVWKVSNLEPITSGGPAC